MFHVNRFDPREEDDRKTKKQKRKREKKEHKKRRSDKPNKQDGSLRVIAEETDGSLSRGKLVKSKISEEAFDDLGLTERDETDVIEGDAALTATTDLATDLEAASPVASYDPNDETQRALLMSDLPIDEAARRWKLAPFLVRNLKRDGCSNFFPIQALVIPEVILSDIHVGRMARDICVAAPTGSGKTLAFCIPVLNALFRYKIRRLRALVVLPSRDLAQQVHAVFEHYARGSHLKVGLAIGQTNLQAEQLALVVGDEPASVITRELRRRLESPSLMDTIQRHRDKWQYGRSPEIPAGGVSAVDVLVCTPGRLVDHLDNTPGFSLQHLHFLVIDEADRLLSQTYHGWIPRVLNQTGGHRLDSQEASEKTASASSSFERLDCVTWRPGDDISTRQIGRPIQLRKLLYSATLTRDPQKLATLQLVNPRFFNAHHLLRGQQGASSSLYSMPEQLSERTVQCTAQQKPLVLLALLLELTQDMQRKESEQKSMIVIFTASVDSTHRLARLLQLLWKAGDYGEPPLEFSSSLNQHQRSILMARCKDPNDRMRVLVCSDGMSRGMDVSSVSVVINYDIPGFAKTYVHRCGRTARAGKKGEAISILKGAGQAGQFRKLRQLIEKPMRVRDCQVKTSLVQNVLPMYKACVRNLGALIDDEAQGTILPIDLNIDQYVPRAK